MLITTLQDEFEKLMDQNNPNFFGFPQTPSQVATNWATAIDNYASEVIPISVSSVAAKNAFIGTLSSAVAPGSFFPLLVSAFTAYASALALGMQPLFTGVPPVTPINFAPVLALPLGTPVAVIIATFVNIIDTWFRTGTATNNSSGATILWT